MKKFYLFDLVAAIVFVAAHFISVAVYDFVVVDDAYNILGGGFSLHLLIAAIYLAVSELGINYKLRMVALITAFVHVAMAANWSLLQIGFDAGIQSFFYDSFTSIIIAMNSIVIYLLGRNSAIHIFNALFVRRGTFG